MGGVRNFAGAGDIAVIPVASLWNIVVPLVPNRADPVRADGRCGAATTVEIGEISGSIAGWRAGICRRAARNRNSRRFPSKRRAGCRQDGGFPLVNLDTEK
jgi:hypothetical protein